MPTAPQLVYIRTRLAEARDMNAADSHAARTPEERGFVTGQRLLLHEFAADSDAIRPPIPI